MWTQRQHHIVPKLKNQTPAPPFLVDSMCPLPYHQWCVCYASRADAGCCVGVLNVVYAGDKSLKHHKIQFSTLIFLFGAYWLFRTKVASFFASDRTIFHIFACCAIMAFPSPPLHCLLSSRHPAPHCCSQSSSSCRWWSWCSCWKLPSRYKLTMISPVKVATTTTLWVKVVY